MSLQKPWYLTFGVRKTQATLAYREHDEEKDR
jgi:hypothetical protein